MLPSIFEVFKIGIGPSSSHTVGPMIACNTFISALKDLDLFNKVSRIKAYAYGSLAMTGIGHATDKAIILGLMGESPKSVDVDKIQDWIYKVRSDNKIILGGTNEIKFSYGNDLVLDGHHTLPEHPNGLKLFAFDQQGLLLYSNTYFSIGGGNVLDEKSINNRYSTEKGTNISHPYPFTNAQELLDLANLHKKSIAEITFENEMVFSDESYIKTHLQEIWQTMNSSIYRGYTSNDEVLPGGLNVKTRAPNIYQKILKLKEDTGTDSLFLIDWITLYAISVNEENARGGRVVTAPTNGSAGVIPAVIKYYEQFVYRRRYEKINRPLDEIINEFLLTAAAIGMLYKKNASISAAEMGCQGEIGVSSSMAAAGLTAIMGGTAEQIENAAEIAMEHHLGMTCDPINGLVQVPCIERNSMGAIKAISASKLALLENGIHLVSLDNVIQTMFETGKDMQIKYKETSEGGLATVNIVDC